MRAVYLFLRLLVYYAVVTIVILAILYVFPWLEQYLPLGGAETLLSGPGADPFESIEIGAENVTSLSDSLTWLTIALVGAVLTALPVSWVYMAMRKRKDYDQSLVETILVLPIAVTAIVVIVHNSLALAFSLAGIVGGVRFRNSLKSSGDALFILLSIGIGLAGGTGALEIAIVMSVIFNFCIVALWFLHYGKREGGRDFMREPEVNGSTDER
ncbi:MAG: DUF4956 domain-containing protein [Pseudomonadota bacterium]